MKKNTDAYLGFALMWREDHFLSLAEDKLKKTYSGFFMESLSFEPQFSRYYHKEMGAPLYKKFVLTSTVIDKSTIKDIKIVAVSMEDSLRVDGKRTVNIDPFYMDKDQIVVSTSKYRGNRIYIGDGVFVELELFYHHGSFQAFVWTYTDYKDHIPFFNDLRKKLK